ncbi:hypothetical protein OD917_04240 [Flavobacterium sp. SH_e]|uniref:DUF6624 domain-containing protein n=1 Tax=Flavobacterium TaxID=237 RepID=UPI0021E503FA|nr:DUF6624 domain-containing protein [Flavobacterium sp. SH_e]MCV2484122.1 hypothetical protein [Flavobacterium sp. SH_e]
MKKSLLLILFLSFFCANYAQDKINQSLKIELDSIMKSDQLLREYVSVKSETRKEEIIKEAGYANDPSFKNRIWLIMKTQDSINLIKIEKIITEFGYPGKTLVGEPTNVAAFYVIQHSSEIAQYLPLIEQAAKKGEISFTRFAMMKDRYLTQQGKEQIYGTQIQGKLRTNPETNRKEFFYYFSPMEDPSKVNKRRKKAGFETTIEEYAKEMDVEYKVYTLDEIKKMN